MAQGVIPGFRDQVPHQAPSWSLLLPLPVSLPLSLSLLVSLMNKLIFKKNSYVLLQIKDVKLFIYTLVVFYWPFIAFETEKEL